MNLENVKELERLIETMDLPSYRKTISSKDGVRWLNRNISSRNSEHENIDKAKEIILKLL